MKRYWYPGAAAALVVSLVGGACGGAAGPGAGATASAPAAQVTAAPSPAKSADPIAALTAAAKAEKEIVTYGLPNDWVNYGGIWKIFESTYGIKHTDTDMSSGQIVAALDAERGKGVADATDLGFSFATLIQDKKLSQPYKPSKWSEIPEYARDPDGRWAAAYWGAISFAVNTDIVKQVPLTWQDLLKPVYQDKICMRDPRESATGGMVVLAAAYANGGSVTNVQPGLDYFAKMKGSKALRGIKPSTSNIQKGECPIALFWDFDGFSKRDDTKLPLQVVIPSDGTVAGLYVQFVSASAPHPNAAKLLLETAFSDAGQLEYARGYAHPIRKIAIPAELAAKTLPESAYASVQFPKDPKALDAATAKIAEAWATVAGK
jgi:putative spermidine/putrescine transport system substrate-binding protein